jgi:hypothetical protein
VADAEFARPIDWKQQFSMLIYTLTGALCALNLPLNMGRDALFTEGWHDSGSGEAWLGGSAIHPVPRSLARFAQAEELLADVAGLVASHGMLILATVVHHVCTAHANAPCAHAAARA